MRLTTSFTRLNRPRINAFLDRVVELFPNTKQVSIGRTIIDATMQTTIEHCTYSLINWELKIQTMQHNYRARTKIMAALFTCTETIILFTFQILLFVFNYITTCTKPPILHSCFPLLLHALHKHIRNHKFYTFSTINICFEHAHNYQFYTLLFVFHYKNYG